MAIASGKLLPVWPPLAKLEVVYRDAVSGGLLPQSLVEAAERFFEDGDPATEINAVAKQETAWKNCITGQPLQRRLVEVAQRLELD